MYNQYQISSLNELNDEKDAFARFKKIITDHEKYWAITAIERNPLFNAENIKIGIFFNKQEYFRALLYENKVIPGRVYGFFTKNRRVFMFDVKEDMDIRELMMFLNEWDSFQFLPKKIDSLIPYMSVSSQDTQSQ